METLGAVNQIQIEDVLTAIAICSFAFGGIVWIVTLFVGISKKFDKITSDRNKLKHNWALTLQGLVDEIRWLDARIKHLEQFEKAHGFQPRSRPPSPKVGIEFYNENRDEDDTQIPRL